MSSSVTSTRFLDIFRVGGLLQDISLGSLLQHLATLSVKKLFLISKSSLPWHNLRPFLTSYKENKDRVLCSKSGKNISWSEWTWSAHWVVCGQDSERSLVPSQLLHAFLFTPLLVIFSFLSFLVPCPSTFKVLHSSPLGQEVFLQHLLIFGWAQLDLSPQQAGN